MESATTPAISSAPNRYSVADLQVDIERRRVTRADVELSIAGLSFEFFLALLRSAPNLVSVDELIRRVWPGLMVSQETVTQRVKMIRRALDDDAEKPRYISGVRGRGYCLVAPVVALATPDADERIPPPGTSVAKSNAAPTEVASEPKKRVGYRIQRRWYLAASLLAGLLVLTLLAGKLRRDGATIRATTELNVASPTVRAPAKSVAVLPFVNLTGDPAKDYLGDGMAEEVINALATVPGLKIPARTSSFSYKNRNV
ncbi:MAG TPA: winged helix-turn-helix domain-containing protein, partial [Steroidobacteraceae bacterium]